VLRSQERPRPKWEVLSVLNYLVLTVFTASITFTFFNYRRYFTPDEISGTQSHNIFPMLILWTICMVRQPGCQNEIPPLSHSLYHTRAFTSWVGASFPCAQVYFFGFFGISFLDKTSMARSTDSLAAQYVPPPHRPM
jgi:hypothetical protein